MADIADIAQRNEEFLDNLRLQNRPVVTEIPTSETCLYCSSKTNGKRWCDAECRDLYSLVVLKKGQPIGD